MKFLPLLILLGVVVGRPASAAEPFEVLRPGDQAMTCQELAAEVNGLTAAISTRAKAAETKARRAESGRKMLGFAAGAMSGAMPLLASRGGGVYAAQAAMSAVQQSQMAAQMSSPGMDGGQVEVQPDVGGAPEQARIDRLNQIFAEKAC